MLVGLEIASEVGGSPDRPEGSVETPVLELMAARVVARVPWMTHGTYRTAHGGQDGITPDERPILGPAGPDGFYLACGFSGTGFKTAPAIGAAMAELILDGRTTSVDISGYDLARFGEGRALVGEHPYGTFWR
jgi:glycine/D-amino acid oxidase-like deaminating enzyme